jgi:hypothetical protein
MIHCNLSLKICVDMLQTYLGQVVIIMKLKHTPSHHSVLEVHVGLKSLNHTEPRNAAYSIVWA